MTEENIKVDRRSFIRKSTEGGIALSLASMTAPALGAVLGANERIRLGFIGVGGRGSSLLNTFKTHGDAWNVETAAVCDIYEERKKRAQEVSGGELYHDYEELLARDDLDGVVIATPDHWHMPMTVDALKAGKHVYCEKPMTRTFKEAKKVYETTKKHPGLILQIGTQYTSEDQWYQARNAIAAGDIGKLLWSHGGYSRNTPQGEWNYYEIRPGAGPQNVDWKRFLGSAPKRDWDADRYFRWRKYWDYSGGIATDLFYHKLAPMLIALGPELPVEVSAGGGIFLQKDGRDVPDTFFITANYPSEHTVLLCSSMANDVCVSDIIRGNLATIYMQGSQIRIVGQNSYKDKVEEKFGGMETTIKTVPRSEHQENLIKAMRGMEQAHCGPELAYKTMGTIALGVDAYRQGKTIHFDPKKQKIISRRRKA